MPAVARIEQGREALVVLAVHPVFDFLLGSGFVELLLLDAETAGEALADLLDKELDDVEVAFVGELVEDSVVLVVGEGEQVLVGILLQVIVQLVNFAIGEEDLDDFAFLPARSHAHPAIKIIKYNPIILPSGHTIAQAYCTFHDLLLAWQGTLRFYPSKAVSSFSVTELIRPI